MKTALKLPTYWRRLAAMALCLAAALAVVPVCSAQPAVTNNFATTSAYLAVLGRDPDPAGWIYWQGTLTGSLNSQQGVFNFFLTSTEYASRYGTPDAAGFLTILYQDALLREPDPAGYAAWLSELPPTGSLTEAQVVAYFIGGSEYGGNANGQYADTYQTAAVAITGMSQSGNGQINTYGQTISIVYTNPLNTTTRSDIASGEIFIGADPSSSTTNGCYVEWFSNGTFVLYDGASSYTGQQGSPSSLTGTYCSLTLNGGTGVVQNSTGYTVTLSLTFNAAMGNANGTVNNDPVWANGMSNEGLGTGWANEGNVSVSQYDVSVTVTGSPEALTWQNGPNYNTATFTVNYQALNGYTGVITLGAPSMQYNLGYLDPSLGDYQVYGNGSVTLTVTYRGEYTGSNDGAFLGSFTASVSGGTQHTIPFEVDLVSAPTFTISPNPPTSQAVGASGTASYELTVPNNGFVGDVTFTSANVTQLPSGVTANFSGNSGVSIQPGQGTTLNLVAAPGTNPGTYTPVITATSGSASATATVTLSVAGPATMFSPASGAILPGGSSTFAWAAALGATQYQVLLGSSNGASNYYSANVGGNTSATATLPTGNYTLVASLGTLTGGNWQWTYTQYQVNSQAQFSIPVLTPGQGSINVPMNNLPVTQVLTFEQGPGYASPQIIQICESDDAAFSVRIASATPTTLTLQYTATALAIPQLEPIGCTCPGGPGPSPPRPLPVPPPAPVITEVVQPSPFYGGMAGVLQIYGSNFGSQSGNLTLCPSGSNPCVLPNWQLFPCNLPPGDVCTSISFDTWTDNFIEATVTLSGGYEYFPNWQVIVVSAYALASTSTGDFGVDPNPNCAWPVMFQQTGPGVDVQNYQYNGLPDVRLQFSNTWQSSTHNLNDLASCTLAEQVQYFGTGGTYTYPSPPFPSNQYTTVPNPTATGVNGSVGGFADYLDVPGAFVKPYTSNNNFVSTQTYGYQCQCVNNNAFIPFPSAMGMQINHALTPNNDQNATWRYATCRPDVPTSAGTTSCANENPLPQ